MKRKAFVMDRTDDQQKMSAVDELLTQVLFYENVMLRTSSQLRAVPTSESSMVSPLSPPFSQSFAAVILAAGQGRRMGGIPKSALLVGGHTVLARQTAALRQAGIGPVNVVVGFHRDQLAPLVTQCGAQLVVNVSESPDITTSQATALRHHARRHADLDMLVLLGDLPLLIADHILRLVSLWHQRDDVIDAMVPLVDGVRGHPVLLSARAVQAIVRSGQADAGIRSWMARHAEAVRFVEMGDPAYIQDLDTPEDLARIGATVDQSLSRS